MRQVARALWVPACAGTTRKVFVSIRETTDGKAGFQADLDTELSTRNNRQQHRRRILRPEMQRDFAAEDFRWTVKRVVVHESTEAAHQVIHFLQQCCRL